MTASSWRRTGGTLFLDEVGELPPAVQVKLLRAIQEGEVEPVGGKRPIRVNVRLISATNRNLLTDVKSGRFREDLFYRLHVFPITVPPLRERAEDIPELTRHFMVRFAAEEGKRVRAMPADALRLLASYHWPGNVRQLENAIFRAVVLAEGEEIGLNEFPQIAAQACERDRPSEPLAAPIAAGKFHRSRPGARPRHRARWRRPDRSRRRPLREDLEMPPNLLNLSMIPVTPGPSKRSRRRRSGSPCRTIATRCRKWRGGCTSAAPRFTASSTGSGLAVAGDAGA